MSFWWCLEHKRVEEGLGCGSTSRLGPYDSEPKAASALERIGKREEEQQQKDRQEEKKFGKKTWL
jgi:hypothetical protein